MKYLSYLVGSGVLRVVANSGVVFVGRYSSSKSSALSSTIAWNGLVIGDFELTGDLARDSLEIIGLAGDSIKVGGLRGEIISGLISD